MTRLHTPANERPPLRKIKLVVDGVEIETIQGKTVLHAAIEGGIYIPHLCDYHDLTPFAGCRMCLVEVERMRGLETACTIAARDGMVVRTNTALARQHQRGVLEVLLSDHPDRCLNCPRMERCGPFVVCQRDDIVSDRCVTCPRNKNCELQRVVDFVQWREQRFFNPRRIGEPERSNPFVERYPDYCIYCARCVRVCDEVIGVSALGLAHRGTDVTIAVDFEKPLTESTCIFCGRCAVVCPTGALMKSDSKYAAAPTEKTTPSVCSYCGVGCTLFLNTQHGRLANVMADRYGPANWDNLCVRGQFAYDYVQHRDRLRTPMLRSDGGELAPASWDDALDRVAGGLVAVRDKHGPDAIGFVGSGKTTNEESYLFQKVARAVFGTNNVDEPTTQFCYGPTIEALTDAFGSAGPTVPARDLEDAGCLLVIGSSTVEAHPVLSFWVKRAVRHGGKMIVVDPRQTDLCRLAYLHLRPHPGSDAALVNGMLRVIVDEDLIDKSFVESRTEGFPELVRSLEPFDLASVERLTGVPAADVQAAARIYASGGKDERYPIPGAWWGEVVWPGHSPATDSSTICYASGITQHAGGVDAVRALANLTLLTGQIGKRAAGIVPLAGQNNTLGAADMGCLPNLLPGYRPVEDAVARRALGVVWGVEPPAARGKGLVEMVGAIERGEIRALYVMGSNPARSVPGTDRVEAALKKLELLVVQDIFPTETARLAHVVLPGASAAEKDGTFTNTERRIQRIATALQPVGQSRPDWQILCEVGRRASRDTGSGERNFGYASPAEVMDEIAGAVELYRGVAYDRLGAEGLQWPVLDRDDPGASTLYSGGFERGRARLAPAGFADELARTSDELPLLAIGGRTPLWNTGAISRRSKGLTKMWGDALVWVNPTDAERLGLGAGDLVRIGSASGRVEMRVRICPEVLPGQVFVPIHHPDQPINRLVPFQENGRARRPSIKSFAVRLERLAGPPPPAVERGTAGLGVFELPIVPGKGPGLSRP
ncbi:MAG TPA: molybdopterin-dependent oxidoreductase [Chloroflexota bacterium]